MVLGDAFDLKKLVNGGEFAAESGSFHDFLQIMR